MADALAPQLADGADGLVGEQLVAAGMNAGQRRDRHAAVEMMDERPGKRAGEMDVTAGDQLRES